jgi:HEAT repeat protein
MWIALLLLGLFLPLSGMAAEPPQFVEGLTSPFENIRRDAVQSAAETGAPAVAPIADLLASSSPAVVKAATCALENIVAHAGCPDADPERDAVAKELSNLLDAARPEGTRREALQLLGLIGGDSEVNGIAALLREPALAEEARAALDRIPTPGAATALIGAIGSVTPEMRIGLFDTLARKEARGAIATIQPYLTDADPETRWRALEALCRLGVAPNNLPVPPQAFAREDRKRYMRGFLWSAYANIEMGNTEVAENMFATLAAFPMGRDQASAALLGLAKLNSPKLVEHALGYLAEPKIRLTAIETLSTADIPGIDERVEKGIPLANPANRVSMLQILAARKSANAGALLAAMRQDPSPEVRVAAFELLGEEPSDSDLQETLRKSASWNREHAAREFLKRAVRVLEAGDAEKARSMFEAVASATLPEELLASAYQGIARVGSAASLQIVDTAYASLSAPESAVSTKAYAAAVECAYASVHAAQPDRAAAESEVRRIVETSKNPDAVKFALGKLRQLGVDSRVYARRQGFITDWRLIGPFPNEEDSAFGKSYFNEAEPLPTDGVQLEDATYAWKAISCDAVPAIVDLKAEFSGGENVCVYAAAELTSAQETSVAFLLGTNDGCEVWLNQIKVHEHPEGRSLNVDEDRVNAVLKTGANTLLIKVLQNRRSWGFCARVVSEDGSPIDTATLQPSP